MNLHPPLKLTRDLVHAADAWGFNCGPAALCGVLGLTPDEARPHLGDFEAKGYMNPTLMMAALKSLGAQVRPVWQETGPVSAPPAAPVYPALGVVRVQWAGTWCNPGVPMGARYRKTHWIAVADDKGPGGFGRIVLDVNAVGGGLGWIGWSMWETQLVPWLIRECVKGGTGVWWPTHCWEVTSRAELDRRAAHACGDEARPASMRPWDDRGWTPT